MTEVRRTQPDPTAAAVRAAQAEALAEELPKHHAGMGALPQQKGTDKERAGLRCSCGEWSAPCPEGDYTRPWGAFWQHVAEALADRLACCDGTSQESASETSDAHTDTAAPEGAWMDERYAKNLIEFVRTFETGEHAANALPIFLRSTMHPAAPVAVEGVETVEACPSDGQSVEWHRQQDPNGRTNGEFIGCNWGRGHIWMPPHHLVGRDLGMRCTECGGYTATTAPCIPGRWAALSPVEPETSGPEGGESRG